MASLRFLFPISSSLPIHPLFLRSSLIRTKPVLSYSIPTPASFCSASKQQGQQHHDGAVKSPKSAVLVPGLYLVATPIGNLEDITLRALRVLRSADVILSEDTSHSGKLLQHFSIETPLISYHKFNEYQREATILKRLHEGQVVALISDAGTPRISDPGMELAKKCISENLHVVPIPGPSALITALSASGLSTDEFTFTQLVFFQNMPAPGRKD